MKWMISNKPASLALLGTSRIGARPRKRAARLLLEREAADRPAGLRTHMLVCGTATLLVTLANLMVASFEKENLITADPVHCS
jgi:hypothetical protein